MGQSSGVLFKDVAVFRRCPLVEVSLYVYLINYFPIFTMSISHCLRIVSKQDIFAGKRKILYGDT